jgi:hypothetical protein
MPVSLSSALNLLAEQLPAVQCAAAKMEVNYIAHHLTRLPQGVLVTEAAGTQGDQRFATA